MKKIILTKQKENFSRWRYFLFTYLKKYSVYEKNIKADIFYIPYRKKLSNAYLKAICTYLKSKKITEIFTLEEDIKNYVKKHFSIIIGKNIYRAIFYDVLNFLSDKKLYEYEIIFVSDNLKEIKEEIEKCVKNVKSISVLTKKPFLYESLKDFMMAKYGVTLNIRTKSEKLKKHNKIYVNSGANRVFEKNTFKNVNMIDIYGVYDGAFHHIIMEPKKEQKEYTKLLKCPYSAALAEFLNDDLKSKNNKIINIKK